MCFSLKKALALPLLLVVVAAISGCNNISKSKPDPNKSGIHQALLSGKNFDPHYFDTDAFRNFANNRTLLFYDTQHGTQVEYHSSDGKTYLWYPGNSVIVPGSWKVQSNPNLTLTRGGSKKPSPEICFKYPASSFNPVTQRQGGDWQCRVSIAYGVNLQESRQGDVFGLSKQLPVPFVLPKSKQTIQGLLDNVN